MSDGAVEFIVLFDLVFTDLLHECLCILQHIC